jgi:hypothetical protein
LTACCIELARLIKRGIRMVLPEVVDDLPPMGINPRRIATAMRARGVIPGPPKTHDQFSHKPRADRKTLGQLTD